MLNEQLQSSELKLGKKLV